MAETLTELADRKKYNYIDFVFPDDGKYPREKYPKSLEFFAAGLEHSMRAFMAANRIGKTTTCGTEFTYHMTGKYPHWWNGKRFNKPINAWVASVTPQVLREAVQEILYGTNFADKGTGLIPRTDILDDKGREMVWAMIGAPNCIGIGLVRHYDKYGVFDGYSKVEFKSYEMGWEKFQGAKRDLIWLDEEPKDPKIYSECITRTAGDEGQEGLLMCSFTPLQGYSTIVLGFLPNGQYPEGGINPHNPAKYVVCAGWDHVPHLSEKWKREKLLEYSPQERDARSKGIPTMGEGRVFPIDEDFVVVESFNIPDDWPRIAGLDFGWHATACLWLVKDPSTDIVYAYAEYQRGKVVDTLHIEAIKARGDWIPIAGDPSGGGRKDDGILRIDYFRSQGLNIEPGENAIIGYISILNAMFESGSLKIMKNCQELIGQLRIFHYDPNKPGYPAQKQNDHLIDALKYGISKLDWMAISFMDYFTQKDDRDSTNYIDQSRDSYTGY